MLYAVCAAMQRPSCSTKCVLPCKCHHALYSVCCHASAIMLYKVCAAMQMPSCSIQCVLPCNYHHTILMIFRYAPEHKIARTAMALDKEHVGNHFNRHGCYRLAFCVMPKDSTFVGSSQPLVGSHKNPMDSNAREKAVIIKYLLQRLIPACYTCDDAKIFRMYCRTARH